jgi:hypothetical protein
MKMIEDESRWHAAMQDTPFGTPKDPKSADEAMRTPSCRLKSKEPKGAFNSMPKYFGILVSYNEEENHVLVRSFGPRDPIACAAHPHTHGCAVWEGTTSQYWCFWNCD